MAWVCEHWDNRGCAYMVDKLISVILPKQPNFWTKHHPKQTEAPEQSSAVLFHMMLHYKTESDALRRENENQRDQLALLQHDLHLAYSANMQLGEANRRGAELVMQKHEAGVMLLEYLDRMAALLGTMRREIPGHAMEPYVPEIERILLRGDFAAHVLHGMNMFPPTNDEDIIDLTGEETETDVETEDEMEVEL